MAATKVLHGSKRNMRFDPESTAEENLQKYEILEVWKPVGPFKSFRRSS